MADSIGGRLSDNVSDCMKTFNSNYEIKQKIQSLFRHLIHFSTRILPLTASPEADSHPHRSYNPETVHNYRYLAIRCQWRSLGSGGGANTVMSPPIQFG